MLPLIHTRALDGEPEDTVHERNVYDVFADDHLPLAKCLEQPITPPISDDDDGETPVDVIAIEDEPVIAVLGVGYVGTHLVSNFASRYQVIGFDVSSKRIRQMQKNFDLDSKTIQFTCDPRDIGRATHFLISVPTLLRHDKTVDSTYLRQAINTVGIYARQGATVVMESSVAVGMTRELLGPVAVTRGFYAGMSPEVSH